MLLSVISVYSQKTYKKLDKYFEEGKYDKCIESAKKYKEKDSKNYILPFFISKSYFELYKIEKPEIKKKNLRNSLKYAYKIKKADKKAKFIKEYETFLNQLYKSTVKYTDSLFNSKNKDKAETYYSYIAKNYNDTLYGYFYFYPQKKNNNVGLNITTQKVNQTDANGMKQGLWTKKYKNGVVAYKVYFKNNKPVGEYKRYHENGKLYALLNYREKSDTASAKLYDEEGVLIAKGTYLGKKKINKWTFFSKKLIIRKETYTDGKKNGVSQTFYKNGNVSEEQHWKDDVENGVWRQYFENKKVKLEMRIDNGKRNSAYYKYYPSGKFEIKGRYINDLMEGTWEYFDIKGKVVKKIEYIKGKAQNQDELDKEEQEYFEKIEENKHRLLDPANFRNDPTKYMKNSGK